MVIVSIYHFFGTYCNEYALSYLEEYNCVFMCVNIFICTHILFQVLFTSWSFHIAILRVSQGVTLGANLSLSCFRFTQMSYNHDTTMRYKERKKEAKNKECCKGEKKETNW